MEFYKATRPDGTDFRTGKVDYAGALTSGEPITLPEVSDPACCTGDVLHASTVPTETLIGGHWPCRLFIVEGSPVAEEGHKRGFFSLRVVREIDAHEALGPQGREISALVDPARALTGGELDNLSAARAAAWDAAWAAARAAARDAAAFGLSVRDLIGQYGFTQERYDLLTGPWRRAIGQIHADDADLKEE